LQKRSQSTITIDISESILKPQKKMRIMCESNLNYVRLDRYLSNFLNKGFIEVIKDDDEGNGYYCITQRGKALLLALRKGSELGYLDVQ
jgi:predicted transcriptional regulator